MRRLTVIALSALLGATLSLPAAAQWKWRDKGGQIQYSDLPPPPGVGEKDILQRPNSTQRRAALVVSQPASAASAVAPAAPTMVEPELEAKRRKVEQEQAAKKKAEDEKVAVARAENCTRAKGHLRALEDGVRMARSNEKGEREILDDKARADETRRTREIIAADCK